MVARLLGHPVHQMLIVFPLGLLGAAVIFDVVSMVTGNSVWTQSAFFMISAGIAGGLLAALFGLIDWLGIAPNTRAKRVGFFHGAGNVVVVVLFAVSWFQRVGAPSEPETGALVWSFAGGALMLVTGWMGGELVNRLGVGVDEGANLNAPSSLSGRPAAEGKKL